MKKNWKKLFFWSSVGSLAIGATVALVRKPKRREGTELVCRPIPADCAEIMVWTERFRTAEPGDPDAVARDRYVLQPTPFRLWSVLDVGGQTARRAGKPIYHVARYRLVDPEDGTAGPGGERLLERFYSTAATRDTAGRFVWNNCLARGGCLELEKCYVGGSSNGVPAGETHLSEGPILNFQFRRTTAEA